MRVATSIVELTDLRDELTHGQPRPTVALVPTMGALHAGHTELIRIARNVADVVVVTIFVNPLQFGPDEDYARYPRSLEADLTVCQAEGVDLVFAPSVAELYPAGRQVTVSAGPVGQVLEGAARPGHFDGMLTVVLKLLNIIRPDTAVLGQKDAQQLACIQRMVVDLNLPVNIVGAPTVREPDGLARSSRNVFLSAAERTRALSLSTALEQAKGESSVAAARVAAYGVLNEAAADPTFRLDYAVLVNPVTFTELPDDYTGPAVLAIAARIGTTRLIDNAWLTFAPVTADV
jgi:pantoate--beta-alanine ligase